MPHHAIQPHHHHHIQTANPKKQQAVSPHTHTHCTHIPITSERTAQKPRTTWFCYQDDLLCQHLCVTDCVWIQAKISVLPLGSKKPGLPPLHWRTWGDSQLLLMWRNKLEQQKYIPILKYIYVYLYHKKTNVCNTWITRILYRKNPFATMFTCVRQMIWLSCVLLWLGYWAKILNKRQIRSSKELSELLAATTGCGLINQ